MRYIPKHLASMQSTEWSVWDTQANKWYIWAGYPAVRTSDYQTVLDWCKELNK
jgi:hypothetical protein